MNTKKTIAFFAIAMAVAFVASVGMASATLVPVTKTLWANNSLDNAGTVTVSDDGTKILITYDTTGGWELTAYHIYVSDVAPTKSAPGRFPFKNKAVPATTSITVPTINLPPECTTLYIAAQAKLQKFLYRTDEEVDVYQYESGWADGDRIPPGKNWAMYFTYVTYEMLGLENKDPGTWQPIIDEMSGILGYCPSGHTFDFVFDGQGLVPSTDYSLIYYADYNRTSSPHLWGGGNPGALIATGRSDTDGYIHLADSKELGMDLPCSPDWNINPDPDYCDYHNTYDDYDHCSGAKIWLVPSADYSEADKKVTTWNPTKFLFETDLITYDDTDV